VYMQEQALEIFVASPSQLATKVGIVDPDVCVWQKAIPSAPLLRKALRQLLCEHMSLITTSVVRSIPNNEKMSRAKSCILDKVECIS